MSFSQWTRRLDERVLGRPVPSAAQPPPPWWFWLLLAVPPLLMPLSIAFGPWVGLAALAVYIAIGAVVVVRRRRSVDRVTAGA